MNLSLPAAEPGIAQPTVRPSVADPDAADPSCGGTDRSPSASRQDAPRSGRRGATLQFDASLARRLVGFTEPLLHRYFRSEVRGVENLPPGQTMLVANHDGGMLPLDGLLIGAAWHRHFDFQRPLGVLVHDMVSRFAGWVHRIGGVLADRPNLEALLRDGHSVLIYPGGSRETFRSFWQRKQLSLGGRTGFVKQALRYRLPITPVVSVGLHETFFVLWRGGWLADRLGITRHFRADVFPVVAGLPFGIWLGVTFPQLPLPSKLTIEILPPIDVIAEAERLLRRPLRDHDCEDPRVAQHVFAHVRDTMQDTMTRLYAARRYPVIG